MSQDETDLPDNEPHAAAAEVPEEVEPNTRANAANAASAAREQASPQADASSQAQPDDAGADGDAQDDWAALREALAQKTQEADQYRDQALRAAAEADNVRKRAQRDVEAVRKFALEKFAGELLGVRDSLEMGLQAGTEEQADIGKVVEGMELTSRMLASVMEKFGIEVVNPQGEAFDPELHEAVSTQPTDAQAPNTVVAVVQKGYTLNGRVLRAAMVVVAQAAQGGP